MNIKRLIAGTLIGATVLFSAGCATSNEAQVEYYKYLQAEAKAKEEVGKARYEAEKARYFASAMAVQNADSSAKTAAAMALNQGSGATAPVQNETAGTGIRPPETMEQKAYRWANLLINGVAPWYVQDRNGQRQAEVAITNSNNQAQVQMNTNGTMLGLGLGREAFETAAPLEFSTPQFQISKPQPQ